MSSSHVGQLYLHRPTVLHGLAAHTKVSAAALFVVAVAVTPRRSVWVFALAAGLALVGLGASGLGPQQVLRRYRVLAAFIPIVALLPFVAGGDQTEILGVSVSTGGLWGSWNFLVKAVLGLAVSLILTATTTIPQILAGLATLRAPRVLVAIAGAMVRYLDVIVAETTRTRVAMLSRGYAPRWIWQLKPLAYSAGTLFVRSYERSERVHTAMLARGFTGTMPAPSQRAPLHDWVIACGPAAVMVCAATAAIIY